MTATTDRRKKRVAADPAWRDAAIAALIQAGPTCRHAAQYIVDHAIPIGFSRQSTGARWTIDGRIDLNIDSFPPDTDPTSRPMLGVLVHEAIHLEQGPSVALSVAGELAGWSAEYRARAELGVPISNPHWKAVARLPDPPGVDDLHKARAEMRAYAGPRYLIWLLPLRPNLLTRAAAGGIKLLNRIHKTLAKNRQVALG